LRILEIYIAVRGEGGKERRGCIKKNGQRISPVSFPAKPVEDKKYF